MRLNGGRVMALAPKTLKPFAAAATGGARGGRRSHDAERGVGRRPATSCTRRRRGAARTAAAAAAEQAEAAEVNNEG